ncbi:hypothetical protein E2C01_046933 [Portunus trituberculatus]|uniref:Uncharacterized protein n=1 Tax=Portunus trituberculatus TaxID=210409 RepID=A0A5B7G639_PORTR|nr:hypothetical protein [Portunus trituberculatus]
MMLTISNDYVAHFRLYPYALLPRYPLLFPYSVLFWPCFPAPRTALAPPNLPPLSHDHLRQKDIISCWEKYRSFSVPRSLRQYPKFISLSSSQFLL